MTQPIQKSCTRVKVAEAGGWDRVARCSPVVDSGEFSRGEKMLESGTDPESYITEYTLVSEDNLGGRKWPDHSGPM